MGQPCEFQVKGEVEPEAKAEGSGEKGSAGDIPSTDARRARAADANASTADPNIVASADQDDPNTVASADQVAPVPEPEAEPEPDVHPSTEPEAAAQNDDGKEGASEHVAKKQQAPPQEEAKARKVRFVDVCVLPVLHVRERV
jgi:hypothetical protein